jgi:hypothetical protein
MANALPQAIGAQVSHPERQVVALSGDGGLAMLMGDLHGLLPPYLESLHKQVVTRLATLSSTRVRIKFIPGRPNESQPPRHRGKLISSPDPLFAEPRRKNSSYCRYE